MKRKKSSQVKRVFCKFIGEEIPAMSLSTAGQMTRKALKEDEEESGWIFTRPEGRKGGEKER
jgi:hypothetical protein